MTPSNESVPQGYNAVVESYQKFPRQIIEIKRREVSRGIHGIHERCRSRCENEKKGAHEKEEALLGSDMEIRRPTVRTCCNTFTV
jgi:hypothetical protein